MVNRLLNFHISINIIKETLSNNWILTIKPIKWGREKPKTNTKTMLVNKANRPHMLINDGMRTLITN